VESIKGKAYPNEKSKPLWAVETSGNIHMHFDPLWGIVNDGYETPDGLYTLRAAKLWLPATPRLSRNLGEHAGPGSLAAASSFVLKLSRTYSPQIFEETAQYTGELSFSLAERFRRLSANEMSASQIPSLILTDHLAAALVGTRAAIHDRPVGWPARLSVSDPPGGAIARAPVIPYRRVIRYDLRYAIPAIVVLALLRARYGLTREVVTVEREVP